MASTPSTNVRGLRQPPGHPKILVHLAADGPIIARLNFMGGTRVQFSVGTVFLSGHRARQRAPAPPLISTSDAGHESPDLAPVDQGPKPNPEHN